jgi:hypothetical protein
MKQEMKDSTGIMTEALCEKYLGLPTAVGRSTKEAFEHIPSKIKGLMGGWGEKLLSCAGRETLIKSVAQAIPTYSMGCFVLSPATCQKITLHQISGGAAKLIAEGYIGDGGLNLLPQNVMGDGFQRCQGFQYRYAW